MLIMWIERIFLKKRMIENKLVNTVGKGEGGRIERVAWKHTLS